MAATSSAPRQAGVSARPRRANRWIARVLITAVLMVTDAVLVNVALIGTYFWRLSQNDDLRRMLQDATDPFAVQTFWLILNIICIVAFAMVGLYTLKRGASRVDEAFKVVVAVSLALFAGVIVNSLLPQFGSDDLPISDTLLIPTVWIATITLVVLGRFFYRIFLYLLRQRGIDTRRLLIVGAQDPGRSVLGAIRRNPRLGYQVVGFLSESADIGSLVEGVPVLGRTASLGRTIRTTHVDEVIIALSGRSPSEVLDVVASAEDEAVDIKLYPDAFQLVTNNGVSVGDVSGLPLIPIKNVALDNPLNRALKRALDLVVSILVMICFSPLMLLIAVLVKLESPGPAFFVQERVGRDNRPFPTLKFRTMRQDAPNLGNWTTKDDPRVTALGRFLRRYSLDELPQFINVLRGDMSVVGPRPEQPIWVERFSQSIPRYMKRHRQKAGITGWAQVSGLRGDTSIEERTRFDLYYVENWSLLFDVKIIILTFINVVRGRNEGY